MYTKGEFTIDNVTYGAVVRHSKIETEAILVTSGTVVSAYKINETGSYSYNNLRAKELVTLIKSGLKVCTSKNCVAIPFDNGAANQHTFIKSKVDYILQVQRGELVGAYIKSDKIQAELLYASSAIIPSEIPYIKLTEVKKDFDVVEEELDSIRTRSIEEIALEKEDIEWIKNKNYYIVNDDETAEKLFTFLDNYNGVIAYDTETTGLKINCFGKINSEYKRTLDKYNEENPTEKIRADKLVGIIFCIENDTSYYFPCFNRKFKNLYQDVNSNVRINTIDKIKARYTIGELRNEQTDIAEYVRSTDSNDFDLGVILMERCRNILETKHLVAHNGSFEWKVGYQYDIDTNIKDDTMIMHQLMYKFRSTTINRGEPSNLKYLAKRELGIDQWELGDFFPDWKPDRDGLVRAKPGSKKKGSNIDFSYMDYDGTRVYAPTDGDVTFQLFCKYKTDMVRNHKEQEYLYSVEVIASCAIAYMEFYGHKLDESKIFGAREQTRSNIAMLESEIRQMIEYSSVEEIAAYNKLKEIRDLIEETKEAEELQALNNKIPELTQDLAKTITENTDKILNLASPAQVSDLFYNKLKIQLPSSEDKPSVAKKVCKALLKEKNEDGTDKYPVVHLYSKYKNEDTLMTKFFDNLPYFMYPGGFIFSSYGQISTATGRMSCSKPNAQQYPKVITKIISPRPGFIMMDADYSQIEYRILTALAKNDWLAELFKDPDSDYHTLMASLMYEVPYASVTSDMRGAAKSFNFGIPYGMGLGSLAILLTGKNTSQTRDEAQEKMNDYFKNQPKTRKFFDNVKEMAQINGYTKTLFDRYRYYSFTDKDGNINNGRKAAALRQAGNAVIQGCVIGSTKIQTKECGIVNIQDVVDKNLLVWDGNKWSYGDILYSGQKRKCIVKFSTGQEFICSPIHKFLVKSAKGNERFVECKDLRGSDTSTNPHRVVRDRVYADELGEIIVVKSVEITDEYIDMYDVCNTDNGYYVADGIITHNTAADIFKIGVARNFSYIRKNKLFGKLLIVNMIHDEQLMEVDVQSLNMQRVLADVGKNMQFNVDGFPPLYIGAGIGAAWGYAKGKMAEIHPDLLDELTHEADNMPIFRQDTSTAIDTQKVLDYFENRVYEFRRKKVADYLSNTDNWNIDIHPAIGGLINLQFNYGRGDEAQTYKGPNGEVYTDAEFLSMNIADFLKENNIPADASYFKANELVPTDDDEDNEYDDDEDDDDNDIILEGDEVLQVFTKVDDSDKTFGSSINDLIAEFHTCILRKKKICGIDTRDLYHKKLNAIIEFLYNYVCDEDDEGAMEIVFLTAGNILKNTGVHIKGITLDKLEKIYHSDKISGVSYKEGDITTRSQAK